MGKDNKRKNYYQELKGLRMVKLYIEEFFHWGFQLIDQENDDGLDGIIIVRDRKGLDTGARIHCQIKCGHGYYRGECNNKISIQPYSPKANLEKHLEMYAKMVEPTILIYVDPGTQEKDGRYSNGMNPPCWWVRLDNYEHDGSTVIRIPKDSRFGEHSKGDLFRMVKPLLKNWNNFPEFSLDKQDKKLWFSLNLKDDARLIYSTQRTISMPYKEKDKENDVPINVTRIGWRHINSKRRGIDRINNSLKLLSVAFRVIASGNHRVIFLREKMTGTKQCRDLYYAIRFRLNIQNNILKVQVVLRQWINPQKNINKVWFYSVHIVK